MKKVSLWLFIALSAASAGVLASDYNIIVSDTRVANYETEYNVKAYGALGDSTGDATAAFKSAAEACNSAGGGKIYVPDGKYIITPGTNYITDPAIVLYDNTVLEMSENAYIYVTADMDSTSTYRVFHIIGSDHVTVRGGNIIGDQQTHAIVSEFGYGIHIAGGSNISIEGVKISECMGDGIYIGSSYITQIPPVNVSVSNCTVFDNYRNGISCVSGDGIKIVGNFVSGSGAGNGDGIDIEPNPGESCASILIADNIIFDNIKGIAASTKDDFTDVVISNNTISNSSQYGLRIVGNESDDTEDSIIVDSNRIRDYGVMGIYCNNLSGPIFSNNVLYGSTGATNDVYFSLSVGVNFTGNSIHGSRSISGVPVWFSESSTGSTISDNMFYNCGPDSNNTTLYVGGDASSVVGNYFWRDTEISEDPPSYCIYAVGDDVIISGNQHSTSVLPWRSTDSGTYFCKIVGDGGRRTPTVYYGPTATTDTSGMRGALFWYGAGDTLKVYTGATSGWPWVPLH